jgi:hypothetical protein
MAQVSRLCSEGLRSGRGLKVGCQGGEEFRDGVQAGGFGGSLRLGTLGTGRQRVVLIENAVSRMTTLLPVTKVFIVACFASRKRAPTSPGRAQRCPSGGGRRRCMPSGCRLQPAWGQAASLGKRLGSSPPLVAPWCTRHTRGCLPRGAGEGVSPQNVHAQHNVGRQMWQVVELPSDGRRPILQGYPIGLGDGIHLAIGSSIRKKRKKWGLPFKKIVMTSLRKNQ